VIGRRGSGAPISPRSRVSVTLSPRRFDCGRLFDTRIQDT